MKFSGAILLWITFTLTGMKASSQLKKRVTVLDETIIFLNSFIAEIEFSKIDIISILYKFSNEASMKNLVFLNKFTEFSTDDCFNNRWKEAIKSFSYYKSEEKDKMLQLGDFLGTTDEKSQINTICLYKTFFEKYKNNALDEYEKYGKVSPLFGLFVGASVFILFL